MLLSRIPVHIIAANPHEYQAVADVLAEGQAGALVLADAEVPALVALICPSGDAGAAVAIPSVVLGARREDMTPENATVLPVRVLPIPAQLADIFTALEALAQQNADFSSERRYGGWRLEPSKLSLHTPDGAQYSLTDTESRLMMILFDAQGESLERDDLLHKVWGYRPGLDTHTLETHIYRLRQKIETNPTSPSFLMTTDSGYRLV